MAGPFRATQTFVPTQIPGCQLWFDAADTSTFTFGSGTAISEWREKSSNAYSVIQATAGNRPSLTITAQNALPGIQFSQSTFLYQTATSMPNFTSGGSTSVLIAARNASVNTSWNIVNTIWFDIAGLPATVRYHFSFNQNTTDGTTLYTNGSLVGQVTSNAVAPSANTIFGFTASATSQTIHTNGSTDSYAGTTLPNATGNTDFIFGDARNNAASADIMIFEMVGYNTQITTAQRQQLEGYLAWKWGMVANLPANHPYKTTPVISLPPFPNAPRVPFATNNPVFVPTQVSGCTLWLDAADASTITGSPITTWRDKSGLANNATATVGPTQSTYSGYPVVTFNGSTQFMDSPNTVPRTTHTLIAVHRPVTITANFQGNTSLFRYQISGPNYIVFPYMAGLTPRGYITSADGAGAGSIDAGNSTLVDNSVTTAFNIIIAVISSGSQLIFRNGIQQSSDTETLTGATSDSLTVGRFTPGLSEYYQGDLGEMIVYSGALSQANRQQVEGYLAWKWGLTSSLPVGHPYRVPPIAPFPFAVRQARQGVFSPNSITGLSLWLDAADASKVTVAGTTLTGVLDKSPSPKTITITNTVTYVQGQSFVFTNTNGCLNLSGMQAAPYDIITVATANSVTNSYRTLLRTGGSPGTHPFLLQVNTDNLGMWDSTGFRQFGSLTMSASEKALVYASMASNRTLQAAKNGTLSLTSPTAAGNESIPVVIGNLQAAYGGGQPWGTLQEICIYNTTLTTLQRQQVEGYLAWKWGLQANLPGNHPYKLFPPAPT
jgi:hypothetical protein